MPKSMKIFKEEGERVIQVKNLGNSDSVVKTKTNKKDEKYGDPEVSYRPPAPRSIPDKTKSGRTGSGTPSWKDTPEDEVSNVGRLIFDKFFPSIPESERTWYGWKDKNNQAMNSLPLVVDRLARDYVNGNISASEIAKRAVRYKGMLLPSVAYVPGTANPLRISSVPTKYRQVEFFKKLTTGNSTRTPLNTRKSNDI